MRENKRKGKKNKRLRKKVCSCYYSRLPVTQKTWIQFPDLKTQWLGLRNTDRNFESRYRQAPTVKEVKRKTWERKRKTGLKKL